MDERKDREQRQPAEGVRIIGADEAQAAIDRGAAAGRRPDDELRFGDVPPAPSGPRPPHRFPLPESVDPAEAVPRPPVVAPVREEERPGVLRATRPVTDPGSWRAVRDEGRGVDDLDPPGAAAASDLEATDETAAGDPSPPGARGFAGVPTAGDPTTAAGDVEAADERWAAFAAGAAGVSGAAGRTLGADEPTWEGDRPLDAPAPAAGTRGPAAGGPGPAASTPDPAAGTPDLAAAATPNLAAGTPDPAAATPDPAAGAPERPGRRRRRLPGGPAGRRPGAAADAVTGEQVPVAGDPHPGSPPPGPHQPWTPPPPGERAQPSPFAPGAAPDTGDPTGERITVSGGAGAGLPHWADPPTGEVPTILAGEPPASDDYDRGSQSPGSRGLRWRDEAGDWDDVEELEALGSEETRVGALDTSRSEHSDLFSFDEEFERLEEERSGGHAEVDAADDAESQTRDRRRRTRGQTRERSTTRRPGGRPVRPRRPSREAQPVTPRSTGGGGGRSASMGSRLAVGAGLIVALLILYFVGPLALLVFSAVAIGGSAAEGYGMLQRAGFRPATLLGLVASVGVMFAAYWKGAAALPLVLAITFVASMLWYLLRIVEARPLASVAVTNLVVVWVGILGSYAALLLRASHGKGLFLGTVVMAVGADIVAYFGGRQLGSRPMAPVVSPGKTWEGATLGFLAAVVVGAIVGHFLTPWGGIKHGLVVGAIIGVFAPIGDVAESMVKRDLGV
ncbi:MAG TPA: phosphatidate cytidylyltransferase, partial [Acidimicrobiales bacterium]|nr:phosphatidate cytidylyltransferase [Acidimicrobiales bacterium]